MRALLSLMPAFFPRSASALRLFSATATLTVTVTVSVTAACASLSRTGSSTCCPSRSFSDTIFHSPHTLCSLEGGTGRPTVHPIRRMASLPTAGEGASDLKCLRLLAVKGDHDKANDVVYCGKASNSRPESNIIYFGGDVQDFSENMLAHRDNKHYEEWNLEATAQLLQERFSNSHIWVVRPSKMHLKTFSDFAHFVDSNAICCPDHIAGQRSWHHLYKLLQNAAAKVSAEPIPNQAEKTDENLPSCTPSVDVPVEMVGFSKGCVVLNQLLYDLGDARRDDSTKDFVERVNRIHWLDGGHNGGSNTWITDEIVLQQLQGLKLRVAVHVTPYQVKDPMRLWIGKEQKKFVERLRKVGIDVMNTLHFANRERSLELHFAVLNKF